ncbi:MAG: hypothetical protein RLZZ422_1112 [Pseudomonadota bacterium]|jgi:hypothetical protein
MTIVKKPGENTEKNGGIYQEIDPKGRREDNWSTVPDNKPLPPTTKPGHKWKQVNRTPDSNR